MFNFNISARFKIKGKSKNAELYPPIREGFNLSIVLKKSIIICRSSSSFCADNNLINPRLSFIPIKNILLVLGSKPVVSISNTNRWISSYSSNPLNSLLLFCIRYCSTGDNMVITSELSLPHGSRPPPLKKFTRLEYDFVVLTKNVKPVFNLSSPWSSNFSIMIPFSDIAFF